MERTWPPQQLLTVTIHHHSVPSTSTIQEGLDPVRSISSMLRTSKFGEDVTMEHCRVPFLMFNTNSTDTWSFSYHLFLSIKSSTWRRLVTLPLMKPCWSSLFTESVSHSLPLFQNFPSARLHCISPVCPSFYELHRIHVKTFKLQAYSISITAWYLNMYLAFDHITGMTH